MSLRDIASSVRKNPLPQKVLTVNREQVKPVGVSNYQASGQETIMQEKKVLPIIEAPADPVRNNSSYSRGTSVTAIARSLPSSAGRASMSGNEASWEKCRCLKRSGEKLFCTKFTALCAKEKCPSKYIEN